MCSAAGSHGLTFRQLRHVSQRCGGGGVDDDSAMTVQRHYRYAACAPLWNSFNTGIPYTV